MKSDKKLVLFDFDMTITNKDTLFLFTKYYVGSYRYYLGIVWLSVPLTLHLLKILSSHHIKERFLTHYFKGIDLNEFKSKCHQFALEVLPQIIRKSALTEIKRFREKGDRIIIVSASVEEWIKPWADRYELEVIATRLEIEEGMITGKLAGANCNGQEKVNRVKEKVNLDEFPVILAYGDSRGDRPMLALATQQFYKPFRD